MQRWARLVSALTTIASIVTSLCLMLGFVERDEALRIVALSVGLAIFLISGFIDACERTDRISRSYRLRVAIAIVILDGGGRIAGRQA
jgi:predicted histidine transporter YuiF (NhaC family)